MSFTAILKGTWTDFLSAVQFLTRFPVPSQPYRPDSLARAVKFFPFIGLLVGVGAAALNFLLVPHLSKLPIAFLLVLYLILITGCLHEDGLADAADGFGGGRDREHILQIMRDSHIGVYGAAALILSVVGRVILLSAISPQQIAAYLISAHVLCRWTMLPLSYFLPAARPPAPNYIDGQGARIAQLTTRGTLVAGTLVSFAIVVFALRSRSLAPILVAFAVTLCSALYYKRRILGVTGDCFGATCQLTEIAVYLCGAWIL